MSLEAAGADAVGINCSVGPDQLVSVVRNIKENVSIPVIAIGGITADNVIELSGSGICGIAVISAIFAQDDIRKATARLKQKTMAMLAS